MNREDLIAPLQYNLVMEIEKYTKDESKSCGKMGRSRRGNERNYLSNL